MMIALWAFAALVVAGAALVVAVLISESLYKKENAAAMAAVAALAQEVAETAVLLDRASRVQEREPSWFERLSEAQAEYAEALHFLPAPVRHEVEIVRWVWVEYDLITARSWQLAKLARGARLDDSTTIEALKDILSALLARYGEVTNNLRRLRSEELGVDDAQTLGRQADEQLKSLYRNNGWTLPIKTRTDTIRWPGDSHSLLTAD